MANVALVTELYPPSVGGQEVRFEAIANKLAGRGHRVTVLCIGHEKDLPDVSTTENGVTIKRLVADAGYKRKLFPGITRNPTTMFQFAFLVRRELAGENFDAVFANQWPLVHVPLLPKSYRSRSAVDWCEVRTGRFYRFLQAWLPTYTRINVAVSEMVGQQITLQSGRATTVIPSGVDRAVYRSDADDHRRGILYFGRLAEHKNVTMLIEAYKLLRDKGFDEPLTIAGHGPELNRLQEQAEKGGISQYVSFPGFISDEEKIEFLATAKVLVIPSKREGFPRVIAEAYASKLPIVTTAYPDNGSVSVIENRGGGIVVQASAERLAEGVLTVLEHWADYSQQCAQVSEALDWECIIDELEAVLGIRED